MEAGTQPAASARKPRTELFLVDIRCSAGKNNPK